MSLRGRAIEERAVLPNGSEALLRIGVADDPYIAKRELDTVALELRVDGEVAAALNTVLNPDQEEAARTLAREIVAALEGGSIEPTAGDLEPYADGGP